MPTRRVAGGGRETFKVHAHPVQVVKVSNWEVVEDFKQHDDYEDAYGRTQPGGTDTNCYRYKFTCEANSVQPLKDVIAQEASSQEGILFESGTHSFTIKGCEPPRASDNLQVTFRAQYFTPKAG